MPRYHRRITYTTLVHGVHFTRGCIGETKGKQGRFGHHRQREACTGLSTACSGPDQLAAVEGAAPAAFEGALPEEGAAPGTIGNIG